MLQLRVQLVAGLRVSVSAFYVRLDDLFAGLRTVAPQVSRYLASRNPELHVQALLQRPKP